MRNLNLFVLFSIFITLFSLNFFVFDKKPTTAAMRNINYSILNDAEFLITPSIMPSNNNKSMSVQEFIVSIGNSRSCY